MDSARSRGGCAVRWRLFVDRGLGHALRIVEMAKAGIENMGQDYGSARLMELDRITSDGSLYRKRCPLCKTKYRLGDRVLVQYVPAALLYLSWHADCVQALIDPEPKIIMATQEEVDAFVARETARVRDRAAS